MTIMTFDHAILQLSITAKTLLCLMIWLLMLVTMWPSSHCQKRNVFQETLWSQAPSNMATSGREYGLVHYESWTLVSFGHCGTVAALQRGQYNIILSQKGRVWLVWHSIPQIDKCCTTTRHSEMGIHHQSASISIIGD